MKLETKTATAWILFIGGAGVVAGSWFLSKDAFIGLGTLWLREMAAVRSVLFPTRNDPADKS